MAKKLIIVEGTDNSGKDTLINGLKEYFNDKIVNIQHFDRPRSKTNKDCAKEQDDKFLAFFNDFVNINDDRIVICNRAQYGEYVYGTLYRERTKEDVLDMIYKTEDILIENNIDVSYIFLYADSTFLAKNDDGQSLSEGNTSAINKETQLFTEIFEKSNIKKKCMIKVEQFGYFKAKETILAIALATIESQNLVEISIK